MLLGTVWGFVIVKSIVCACPARAGDLTIERLRCEYIENPVGIDVLVPRLSWELLSETRGQRQTAYRILVASRREKLEANQGDLWDTGRVESHETIHIPYAGKSLQTRMECFWKVQVWDKLQRPSEWSTPASWSMGLLKPEDWQAQWIAAPVDPTHRPRPHNGYRSKFAPSADTTKWIVIDLGKPQKFDALQFFGAHPYDLGVDIPGFLYPKRFKIETASQTDFSDAKLVLDRTGADVTNYGNDTPVYRFPETVGRYVRITVTKLLSHDGKQFGVALAEVYVLSHNQNIAQGAKITALDSIEEGGWSKDRLVDDCVAGICPNSHNPCETASMLRKEFEVGNDIRRATVSATGLGVYELRINGQKVGDHLLAPEWTCYDKQIQYQTYDVTGMLRRGRNALGAQVAGGWWASPLAFKPMSPTAQACLLVRMDIELTDGRKLAIVTDPSWQATTDGPIRQTGIYFGEQYDATKEMPGWDCSGFDARNWSAAIVLPCPSGSEHAILAAQPNEPIRTYKEFKPVSITEPRPGVYVFDMGQNMAGWCRLRCNAPTGTKITLRHAEAVDDEGMVVTVNLRAAQQKAEYIWRGGEAAVEPHFSYYGFRYVEATGLPNRPTQDTLVAKAFHSAAPDAGTFSCSSDLVNKIMRCVAWVQRSNMMGVPTDCPQRDEREGWTGDIHAFGQTALFQHDMGAFFTKWLHDIRQSQAADGRLPDVAPHVGDMNLFMGMPGWGDAGAILPWTVYCNYADRRMLEQHFDAVVRWIEFVHAHNPDLVWRNNRGNDCGDWLNADAPFHYLQDYPAGISAVPNEVFATAFFAQSAKTVADMAKALGKTSDAAKYQKLHQDIKRTFNNAFVKADGHVVGDTQAGYALALGFNLVDDAMRPKVARRLIDALRKFKSHPSTGLKTTYLMMLALTDTGHHDEAWRLVNLRTAPSWGFMVDNGATTTWECWDAFVKGRGYHDPLTNSLSHWALGAVGEWVWRNLGGINPDEEHPGYRRFAIRPRMSNGLDWVNADYHSIRGRIVCHWKKEGPRLTLHIEAPVNTTALVYVPAKTITEVTEGGKPIERADGVTFVGMEDGNAVLRIESGKYVFESRPTK